MHHNKQHWDFQMGPHLFAFVHRVLWATKAQVTLKALLQLMTQQLPSSYFPISKNFKKRLRPASKV